MKKIALLRTAFTILIIYAITIGAHGQSKPKLIIPAVGTKAPEVAVIDKTGKVFQLSDIKGKLILLEFWASWCGPCRVENRNISKVYTLYQNALFKSGEKGLTIFFVSLDSKKDAWVKAVEDDNISWAYNVCDLGGWQSKAALDYGVRFLPQNFLIDGKGTIIAHNLREDSVGIEIRKHLK